MKFHGHKLRDFGSKKIKQWQKVENVKSLIEESRFALYNILRNRTKGGVLNEVRRLRDENVEHTKGKIAELFGIVAIVAIVAMVGIVGIVGIVDIVAIVGIVDTVKQTDSDGNITNIGWYQ